MYRTSNHRKALVPMPDTLDRTTKEATLEHGADEELPEDETWETEPEDADGGGDEESENPAK